MTMNDSFTILKIKIWVSLEPWTPSFFGAFSRGMIQIFDIRNYKEFSQSFKTLDFGVLRHTWLFTYIQNLLFKTSTVKKYSELRP